MKKKFIIAFLTVIAITDIQASATTWKLSDLFGGLTGQTNNNSNTQSKIGNTLGNLIEGVFSRSDIEVKDMAGNWIVDGSAVSFKSENFLSQAGGTAAAAALETELNPYYQQYGLTGAELTIDTAGNCNIKLKRGSLNGVIKKNGKGEFEFNITVLGMKMAGVPLYVRKTSQTMDMMFDAAKLKQILQIVAKLSGNQLAQTMIKLLDKYEGIYVGFGMHQNSTSGATQPGTQQNQTTGSGSALGTLRDILTGGK